MQRTVTLSNEHILALRKAQCPGLTNGTAFPVEVWMDLARRELVARDSVGWALTDAGKAALKREEAVDKVAGIWGANNYDVRAAFDVFTDKLSEPLSAPDLENIRQELNRRIGLVPKDPSELGRWFDGANGEWWRIVRSGAASFVLESISERSLERRLTWAFASEIPLPADVKGSPALVAAWAMTYKESGSGPIARERRVSRWKVSPTGYPELRPETSLAVCSAVDAAREPGETEYVARQRNVPGTDTLLRPIVQPRAAIAERQLDTGRTPYPAPEGEFLTRTGTASISFGKAGAVISAPRIGSPSIVGVSEPLCVACQADPDPRGWSACAECRKLRSGTPVFGPAVILSQARPDLVVESPEIGRARTSLDALSKLRDAALAHADHAEGEGSKHEERRLAWHEVDVSLQRRALGFAAAKLAETGEAGTASALILLAQISEGLC